MCKPDAASVCPAMHCCGDVLIYPLLPTTGSCRRTRLANLKNVALLSQGANSKNIRGLKNPVRSEQRDHALTDTEHSILMDVVKAHADVQSSTGNLRASENLLRAASEALAVSQRKYAKGATDILEILTTQLALADATQERIRCLAEWRSARFRLLAAIGMLGTRSIRSNND